MKNNTTKETAFIHTRLPKALKAKIVQAVAKETIARKAKVTENQFVVEALEKAVQ